MPKIFETYLNRNAEEKVLPYEKFHLFSDIGGFHLQEKACADILRCAEKYANLPYELLPASVYMQFHQNGNRSVYQELYFKRRKMVLYLLLGEYIERKGRFTDKLVDGIWLLLEESTWVVPAHNRSLPDLDCPLTYAYKETVDYIDLFSAETGALLAFAIYLGKDFLDRVTPLICDRIQYELNRRILTPFLTNKAQWWMGYDRPRVNNWCPWIASNVLTVCALCERDTERRKKVVARTMEILDHFTNGYFEDGGCDEGPGYWNEAGACYFDCLELLYDMTGGAIDVFSHPFVRNLGEYIAKVNIHRDFYINFADCAAENHFRYAAVARFGRRTGSPMLESFGASHFASEKKAEIQYNIARELKNDCEPEPEQTAYCPPKKVWMDGICVMAARENEDSGKGLFFAMKGGCNAESHNHNDVGNFIVYADGEPLVIDVGVGTYTADTFNEKRYTIWTMQSCYHNLPSIGGRDQLDGREYAAENVKYENESNRLSMELKHAYPRDAGLRSYIRTGELAGGMVKIVDSITLDEPAELVFHLMAADRPETVGAGTICLTGGRTLEYDPSLTAAIEEIEITDPHIQNGWKRSRLYRISLKTQPVSAGSFAFILQ